MIKTGFSVNCVVCGKEVHRTPSTLKSNSTTCSKKCKGIATKMKLIKSKPRTGVYNICENCGTEFYVSKCLSSKRKTCSKKCTGERRSKIFVGVNGANWQGKTVSHICLNCGKEFFGAINGDYKAMYCSRKCKGKHESLIFVGEKAKNWQGGQVTKICEICNKEFLIDKHRSVDAKFCSFSCHGEWLKINNVGENNPSWKGGTSFFPYCPKFNFSNKEIIRNRYGRHCMMCGRHESELKHRLDVHHIDHDKDQGCNGKSWFLVPLCKNCHRKTYFKQEEYQSHFEKLIKDLEKWQPFLTG